MAFRLACHPKTKQKLLIMETTIFRPLPAALIDRMRSRVAALSKATDKPAQLAAIFLIHCECQDALNRIESTGEKEQP